MTPAEFEELAAPFARLEDYLQDQARRAYATRTDGAQWDHALQLAIAAHAQAQLLIEPDAFEREWPNGECPQCGNAQIAGHAYGCPTRY